MQRSARWSRPAVIAAAAVAAALSAGSTSAQTVEQFYKGRQINLLVGTAVGTGYDTMARAVAASMGKYIPGNPTFIVRNNPAGAGVAAANSTYTVAEKDGANLGVTLREALVDPLFSGAQSQATYDPHKFTWIGTPSQDVGMSYVTKVSGVTSMEDATKREVIVAAAGPTSASAILPRVFNEIFHTKFKIVSGYASSIDSLLAMERGEAEAQFNSGWTGPETVQVNDLVKEGKIAYLVQIGLAKMPAYPNVPLIMDAAKNDDDKALLQLLFLPQSFGRPFYGPPGIPADRTKALREAFAKTMKDPDFLAEMKKQLVDTNPLDADGMAALMDRAYAAPKPVLERAIKISAAAAQK